ncbi:ExeA family protein [Aquabacterium sp.]|uniref:ExeA family protein n=1 Tax=Aquabacterium sp. TaxID=1872578 RepID=UPI00378323C4
MYESFFGLAREPFSVAPDPAFLYMSAQHREALEHLNYGLRRGGGFVLLTGEIGAGKSTLWRCFLEQLPPDLDVASVVNPKLGVAALLARVCEDLQVEPPPEGGRAVDPIDALHGHLLLTHARGRRTLIVVDEAQALSTEALEQLRLLTNLDTSDHKLVQVLLIGQPELRELLEKPAMEPLAQRVVARFHLAALSEDETIRYIAHRLAVAGLAGELPFDAEALARVHELCGGVPRRINVLCDRALIAGHAARALRVTRPLVDLAAQSVFGRLGAPAAAEGAAPAAAGAGAADAAKPAATDWRLVAGVAAGLAAGVLVAMLVLTGKGSGLAAERSAGAASSPPAGVAAAAALQAPAAATAATAGSAGAATPVADGPALAAAMAVAGDVDEARAWRALAEMWGRTLPAGDPCAMAPTQGLRCYRGRGGLAPVRQLARPGIVRLVDAQGRSAQALLIGLDAQQAQLRIGEQALSVPLAQLARVWRGDFATLWRAPASYHDNGAAEAGDRLLPWLQERLAAAESAGSASAAANASARERLQAFQLAQGLTPDGVPGPLTLMHLNRASGVDEPRLALGR